MGSYAKGYQEVAWIGMKPRDRRVSSIVILLPPESGILIASTEVRDYVYQALLALVRVHAQVTGIAKPLLDRTMNSLVDDLTSEAFNCFQKVERFGMGGMLRVSLTHFPLIFICFFPMRRSPSSLYIIELACNDDLYPGNARNRVPPPNTRSIRLPRSL